MNKSIFYFTVFVLLAVGGVLALVLINQYQTSNENNNVSNEITIMNNPTSTNSFEEPAITEDTFTMADVSKANSIESGCLVVAEGNVYRIPSSWKNQHPGGSVAIVNSCGRDITSDFNSNHSVGVATRQLESYKVGVLK